VATSKTTFKPTKVPASEVTKAAARRRRKLQHEARLGSIQNDPAPPDDQT